MSFKFHTFNKNKFSVINLLSNFTNNNYQNEQLNINTIRSIQLTNNNQYNMKIKKFLIKKNLEEELSNNKNDKNIETKSNIIKEVISLMLKYNSYLPDEIKIDNYDGSKNNIEFSNIISGFQLILKFLYELKENNEIQNYLIQKNPTKIEEIILKYNKIILNKNKEIDRLENKKIKFQLFLHKNGKDIEQIKGRLYVCDLCPFPYKNFYSYREFHKHYIKSHINPYLILNNNFSILNHGFDKFYFDNKINGFIEVVNEELKETNSGGKRNNIHFIKNDYTNRKTFENRRNKRYETVSPNNNTSITLNNNSNDYNEKRKEIIKKRIEYIENNQRNFEKNFKNQINSFLEEIKNEIINIKENQFEVNK